MNTRHKPLKLALQAVVITLLATIASSLLADIQAPVLQGSGLKSDFNGDGFADLAVGVPEEDFNGTDEGAVNVIYGSAEGLTGVGDQLWHRNSPGMAGSRLSNERFGSALTQGDFNGDGFSDLVIGTKDENHHGAVNVLYGGASGLTTNFSDFISRPVLGLASTEGNFGAGVHASLGAGDFNCDGKDDLVLGNSFQGTQNAGGLWVIYGSHSGLQLNSVQYWDQNTPGVVNSAEYGDNFASELASGDFDGDGCEDLAVGNPSEDWGTVRDSGTVHVLYGSALLGLHAAGDQLWHRGTYGIQGKLDSYLHFGGALSAGDFNGDGVDDLAVGAVGDRIADQNYAGAVHVLYGVAGSGLSSAKNLYLHQDKKGVVDQVQVHDFFGESLAAADVDGDGYWDLYVGVAEEDRVGFGPINPPYDYGEDSGAVAFFHGSSKGVTVMGNQLLRQDDLALKVGSTAGGVMGKRLFAADYNGDGFLDVAVNGKNSGIGDMGGSVSVLSGSVTGPAPESAESWSQGSPGIKGIPENGDRFGGALAQ